MNKAAVGAILLLVAVGVLASFHTPDPEKNQGFRSPAHSSPLPDPSAAPYKNELLEKSPADPLHEEIRQKSNDVSQVTDQPDQVEKDLKAYAAGLSAESCSLLKNYALDQNESPDLRFMAAYLLSQTSISAATSLLEEIAGSPIPATTPDAQNFEVTLRMQAVEGLILQASEKSLNQVATKTNSVVVSDRAQRGLWYLKGQAPHPTQQETDALRKLITRQN